jgi:gluconokinase
MHVMTIGARATVETRSDRVVPVALVVMGPAGTGKTTTAQLLSARLGWEFAEGDRFHPQVNVDKMISGVPLDDADRAPWLAGIRDWISAQAGSGHNVVVTCSALKRSYRDILRQATADVRFVQLLADQNLAAARMAGRTGHYMPPALLPSQYAALESLQPDEPGACVAADQPPGAVVTQALTLLGLGRA